MIINEGSKIPITQFKTLINLKFLFTSLCVIILSLIWLTYENNIFAGLNMVANNVRDKNALNYDSAYKSAWICNIIVLIIFSVFLFTDLFIQILGFTYNFYKLNAIHLLLKIFEVFLLALYFLDSWNYFGLIYIFIVTQLICSILEIVAISYASCSTFKKYNIIRNNEVKYMNKNN